MMKTLCKSTLRLVLFYILFFAASYKSYSQQFLTTIGGWNAYVHLPDDYNTGQSYYPAIIFIPGIGEAGTNANNLLVYGPSHFINQGHNMQFSVNGNTEKPIVISIQPVSAWPGVSQIASKVDSILTRWRVDINRVYLTGLSMGGWCWNTYLTDNPSFANKIAAFVSMSAPPPGSISNFQWYATAGGKWWGFEGTSDYRSMDKIRDTMNAYVPGSARYTQYVGGHCCWNTWYDPTWTENGESIYTWMLKQTKSGGTNQSPTANAGSDQTIVLPTNSVTLSGSGSDPDGSIASYQWTKIGGPVQFTISNPLLAQTSVIGLVQGTYAFELTVTDNQGATDRDTVQVTVSAQQTGSNTANAGIDTVIYLNQIRPDTAILNGSSSVGAASYLWTKISGPGTPVIANPISAVTNVLNIEEGDYQFELTVNGVEKDTVKVFVKDYMKKNIRPCRTGQPQAFTLVKNDPNQLYRPYITRDNLLPGLMGGDTIYIPGGVYTTGVDIGDVGGGPGCPIIIAPKDEPVIIKNNGFFILGGKDTSVVCYAKLDGTLLRSKGYPYGWVVDNSDRTPAQVTRIGLAMNWVHHLDISGFHTNNVALGLMVKMDAKPMIQGQYDKFLLRGIKIFDNYIFRTNGEGMYIGHTGVTGTAAGNSSGYGPPPRMDSVEIYNNIMDSLNLDGIQLSNSLKGCKIYGNFVRRYGIGNNSSHRVGILSGGNIDAVKIYDNMVLNGTGSAIAVFGYGDSQVYHNVTDSVHNGTNVEYGIYMKENAVGPETIPVLVPYATGNIIRNSENYAIYTAGGGTTVGGQVTGNYFIQNLHNSVANGSGATVNNNTTIANFPILFNSISKTTIGYSLSITQADSTRQFSSATAMVDWLFSRLNVPQPPNQPPVANAGNDQTITLPVNTVTLLGSGIDPEGNPITYQWTKLTGPTQFTIVNATQAQTVVNSLVQGVYTFELTVTDNQGLSGKDTVQVTVNAAPPTNQAPVANAGTDKLITLPVNTVTLTGSGIDPDGTIASYQWLKLTGPAQYTIVSPTQPQTVINNLVQGIYTFRLRVTDNQGATGSDTVQVIVNAPPVANAGPDRNITLPNNTTTLNGSGTDPDGTITSYQWAKLSGPAQFVVISPAQPQTVVNNLVEGVYTFELTVTDNRGATDKDTVVVTVNAVPPPGNQAPTANAGNDQTITLPTNSVTVSGSGTDPDGTIVFYQWTKLTGPAQFVIVSAVQAQTAINSLVEGVYTFELKVTDDLGAIGKDTMQVTVNAAPPPANQAPTANAGGNLSITLPANSVTLNGSGNDPDGTISSYQWVKLTGPTQYTIVSAAQAQTVVNNLVQGVYTFELTVTDNQGAIDRDTVQVTVNAAPPANQAPTADAGSDQMITLPVNSIALSGSGSDADGYIVGYLWKKIAGPSQYSIANALQAQTLVNNLVQGVYSFELKVTDNQGAISYDTMQVTVNAQLPNILPVANAGMDSTITLPLSFVTVTGAGTDLDGSIVSYHWTKISGPAQYSITSPNTAQTTFEDLVEGQYQFELTVTDDRGGVGKDTVTITVLPDLRTESTAKIYPNPAVSDINIVIDAITNNNKTKIQIVNAAGNSVYYTEVMRSQQVVIIPVDVSRFPKGAYFVRVGTDINTNITLKFIKQ